MDRWYSVSAYSPEPDHFIAVYQDITSQRRTIEELTLKEEQLQRQNEKQSAFLRISQVVQEMTQPEDLETVLSVCLEQLRRIGVRADTMAIHRVVEPQGLLVETYRVGLNGLVQSPHRRRSRHIVTIWITREPFIRTDMEEADRETFLEKFAGLPIVSCYDVPFNLGVVSVHSTEPGAFSENDRDDLEHIAELFSVGLARMADLDARSQSERQWRELVENVRDFIVTVDRDARIQFINHPLPGRTLGQSIGADLRDSFAPEDRQRASEALASVFEHSEDRQLELRVLVADGTYGWYATRIAPMVENGLVIGAHILSYDITDRKKSEEDFVRVERLRALGEMTAGINHNLNNILTGILGPASMVRAITTDTEIMKEADLIHRSATRATDLIRRLDLSIRGSKEQPRPVDPNRIIEEVVQAARPRWRDQPELNGITIELDTSLAEVALITATESGLHDVLMNLLFNAVDAMPSGGEIHIATFRSRDEIRVVVRDTGIGMDAETQRRVFEPFFTTKADVGTGLGLSTVYSTITGWGGHVDLESEPGQGTTFTLHLPLWEGPAEASSKPEQIPRATRRGRVLVVDDEEVVRTVIQTMLQAHHDVDIARGGWEALDRLGQHRFDVAIVDLGMPGWTGDKVATRMREVDPALATILLTGWVLPDDDARLRAFDFHLQKPIVHPADLLDLVHNAIELHDRRAESK